MTRHDPPVHEYVGQDGDNCTWVCSDDGLACNGAPVAAWHEPKAPTRCEKSGWHSHDGMKADFLGPHEWLLTRS